MSSRCCGVRRAGRARREHEIVAGALPLGAQLPRAHPGERVEPVERADHVADGLEEAIAPGDVRELVEEHDMNALVVPRKRRRRDNQHRAQQSAGEGHRYAGRRDELRRPGQTEHRRCDVKSIAPAMVIQRLRVSRHPAHGQEAGDVTQNQGHGNGGPGDERP